MAYQSGISAETDQVSRYPKFLYLTFGLDTGGVILDIILSDAQDLLQEASGVEVTALWSLFPNIQVEFVSGKLPGCTNTVAFQKGNSLKMRGLVKRKLNGKVKS